MFPAQDQWWSLRLGRPLYDETARVRHVERAGAWTAAQAARLRVSPAEVLRAVACGLLPDQIETLSPSVFLAEMIGRRGTVPTDPGVLRSLRKLRAWWAQDKDRGAAE